MGRGLDLYCPLSALRVLIVDSCTNRSASVCLYIDQLNHCDKNSLDASGLHALPSMH